MARASYSGGVALFLVLAFVIVPLVELALVVAAADTFGLGTTLFFLLAFSIAGAWLVRREGVAVWRRANEEIAAGRPPARELLDGAMILGGGALLLTPGFLTDFVGLFLLLPPTRAVLRPLVMRSMARRAQTIVAASGPGAAGASRFGGTTGFRTVIINTDITDTDTIHTDRFDTDLFDTDTGNGDRHTGPGPGPTGNQATGSGTSGRGGARPGADRPAPSARVIRLEPNDTGDPDGAGGGELPPGN